MFNCLYHVSFMSNHVKQYQATSYYHVWPWCFIPIAPPATEHCVEANTKRPCILPACHCVDTSYSHTFQDHNDIMTWCTICTYPSSVRAVCKLCHHVALDVWTGLMDTRRSSHRGRSGPVFFELSHSRLALPAPHVAALKAEKLNSRYNWRRTWIAWIASGSHLAHLTSHTTLGCFFLGSLAT